MKKSRTIGGSVSVAAIVGIIVIASVFAFLGTPSASGDDVVQRSEGAALPVSFDETVELARVPRQEGDLIASRSLVQCPAEHLFEQVTLQAETVRGDSLDLTWSEAKERMREDFVLTTASEETLRQIALTLDGSEDPFERFMGSFDLAKPETIDWSSQVKLDEGEVLSEQKIEDLTFVASEYRRLLSAQSNAMVQEFEAALLRYWEQDLGYRYRLSVNEKPPEAFLASTHGIYSEVYISTAGDWAVGVRFDSADFPQFDDSITESQRLKEEFYRTAMSVITD